MNLKKKIYRNRETKFKNQPKISLVVPMYNTPVKFFRRISRLFDQSNIFKLGTMFSRWKSKRE